MAEVAAGLHSLVLGEEQILGQVRAGVAEAGTSVREFGGIAIAAARSLRQENQFDAHTGHLVDRALNMAQVKPTGRILIVGAGSVGRLVTLRALELGFSHITVVGRREPEGSWFDRARMRFVPLDRLRDADETDVIVTCLGSGAGELDGSRDLPLATQLIIDLGTPRNVTGTSTVPVMTVATMLAEAAGHRHRDARRAHLRGQLSEILDRRLEMAANDSQSPIGMMRAEIERVRHGELERVRRLHPELPESTIDAITRSLVNQIFHQPSARLKSIDDPAFAARFAALFAAEESAPPEPEALP
jgi:glutamyl-tRNA reductase